MKKTVVTMWVCVVGMVLGASVTGWGAPLGTAFTYQGRLTDQGNPANGSYDFIFRLYDAPSGGTEVGGAIQYNDFSLTDGYFTVLLDFEVSFEGDARWLEIDVRQTGTVIYTTLSPRQELTATPNALYAKVAGSVLTGGSGFWTDSGNDIYNTNSGNVGIGTNTPTEKLEVDGTLRVHRTGGEYGANITRSGPTTDQMISHGLYVEHQGHEGQSGKVAHGIRFRVDDENSAALGLVGRVESTHQDAYGAAINIWGGGNWTRGIQLNTHDTNPSGGWAIGILSTTDSIAGPAIGADISADVGTNSTSEVRGIVSHATHNGVSGDSFGTFTTAVGSSTGDAYGLHSDAAKWDTHTDGTTYGGYLTGRNYRLGGDSYGLYTQGQSSGGTSYGIYAHAFGGSMNWAGYFAGDVFIDGKLQVGANPFLIDGGNVLIHGADGFNSIEEQAILYLGDTNYSVRSEFGFGLKLGTHNAQDAIVVRETTGNVGIDTVEPSEKLEVNGNIKADKVTYSSPRTHYYSVSSDEFIPRTNAGSTYYLGLGNGGAYMNSGPEGGMIAPVHLPHGAVITNFKVFFNDNDGGRDLTVHLSQKWLTSGYTFLNTLDSSGISGLGNKQVVLNHTVNNTASAYQVFAYASNWSASGPNLTIMGALITYTISEAP